MDYQCLNPYHWCDQVRGITTRMGPLGVEDEDGEEDEELIDITLAGQLDPRCL